MANNYPNQHIQQAKQFYATYMKPAKISLIDELPRRESLVELQLETPIVRPQSVEVPVIQQPLMNQPTQTGLQQQQVHERTRSPCSHYYGDRINQNRPVTSQHGYLEQRVTNTLEGGSPAMDHRDSWANQSHKITEQTTITTTSTTRNSPDQCTSIDELMSRPSTVYQEAQDQERSRNEREIAYNNLYQLNPWARPRQIRDPRKEAPTHVHRDNPKWVKECPVSPVSRPGSRASSCRSTTEADLIEKTDQLLREVEDLERKPMNPSQILIEGCAVQRRPGSSQGRLDDESIHTAYIRSPENIDNRSPLPFAFDNFSTLGVRGNIASVGAAEPEKPYPPIFPTIKRTPSPSTRRRL